MIQGVILKPALIYGERNVKLTGPNGQERTLNVPLQRLGGPLARLTGTGVAKKIAGGCSVLERLAVFSKLDRLPCSPFLTHSSRVDRQNLGLHGIRHADPR